MHDKLDTVHEKKLLQEVAAGSTVAFRTIFDAYRDRLYSYLLSITSSHETSEDILQESFLKIWLRRNELSQVENFGGYLFRMAMNGAINGLRRKALEATARNNTPLNPAPAAAPDVQLHFKEVRQVINRVVDTLPIQQKRVYQLRREDGMRIKEIADMMKISDITVKRHLTEAQKKIREAIERSFRDDALILLIILGLASW